MKILSFLTKPFSEVFFLFYLLTTSCFLIAMTPAGEWFICEVLLANFHGDPSETSIFLSFPFFLLGIALLVGYSVLLLCRASSASVHVFDNLIGAYILIWFVSFFIFSVASSIYKGICISAILLGAPLIINRKAIRQILGCYILLFLTIFLPSFLCNSTRYFELNEFLCLVFVFVLLYSETQVTLALIQNAQNKE